MAGELEAVVRQVFDALDRGDISLATSLLASDAQGIDEISRRWQRGEGELSAYMRHMIEMVSDVHSEVNDVHEIMWDDTGLVTFWLEQDYSMSGDRVHISAPTSAVFRRDGGDWRIELIHSIPLPAER